MTALKEEIKKDLQQAVKNKEETAVLVLRGLIAAFLNKEKEKRYKISQQGEVNLEEASLNEEEVTEVIASEAKKRKEAILEYEKGGRADLAEKEKEELSILQKYLPEQLSEQELEAMVGQAIKKTGASVIQDMGKVMAEVMTQAKGKADGKAVSDKVKNKLSG